MEEVGVSERIPHLFNRVYLLQCWEPRQVPGYSSEQDKDERALAMWRLPHSGKRMYTAIVKPNKWHLLKGGQGISKGTITVSSHHVPSQVLISSSD